MIFKMVGKKIRSSIFLGLILCMVSCNSKNEPSQRIEIDSRGGAAAIDLCECMTEKGYTTFDSQYQLKMAIDQCALDLLMEHGAILQLEKEELKSFIKSFLHVFIESECMENLAALINSEILPNTDF